MKLKVSFTSIYVLHVGLLNPRLIHSLRLIVGGINKKIRVHLHLYTCFYNFEICKSQVKTLVGLCKDKVRDWYVSAIGRAYNQHLLLPIFRQIFRTNVSTFIPLLKLWLR